MTSKKKENAQVISQEKIAQDIYSMWIKTKAAAEAKPGQFISMYTNDGSKLLPRPIRTGASSARTTAWNQKLVSSPAVTSP